MSILKETIFKFDLYCKENKGGVIKPIKYSIETPIIASDEDYSKLIENSPGNIIEDILKKYGFSYEYGMLDYYIEEDDSIITLGMESISIDPKYFEDIYKDLKDVLNKNGFPTKTTIKEIVKKTEEERKYYFQVYFTYDIIDDEGYEIIDANGDTIMMEYQRRVPLKVTEQFFEDSLDDFWDEVYRIEGKYGTLDISGTSGSYFGLEAYEIIPEEFEMAFNELKEMLRNNNLLDI